MQSRIWTFKTTRKDKEKRIFVPDNNHTTQENTGGVWFFIAATPKHHGAWTMQVREPRWWKTSPTRWYIAQKTFSSCVGREKFSPLMSGTKNRIFASFAKLSHRKLLLMKSQHSSSVVMRTGLTRNRAFSSSGNCFSFSYGVSTTCLLT